MMKRPAKYQFIADQLLKTGDEYSQALDFKEAEHNYKTSLKYYKKAKDLIGEGYAYSGIGLLYELDGDYPESRIYYEKALGKFQKAKDHRRMGVLSKLIASTYEAHDAHEDALLDYKKSLQSFQKARKREEEEEVIQSITSLEDKKSSHHINKTHLMYLAGYLILICSAELITTYVNVEAGLILHVTILVLLLVQASLEKSYNFSILLLSLVAVPLIRIIGLTIPIMQTPALYWFPIISIPLFAATFTIARTQKISRRKLGLTFGNIPVQLLIGLSGIVLGFIEYQILHPKPLIPFFNIEAVIVAGIILLISTGLAEELLFRGIIQKNAQNLFGNLYGLLFTSLLFVSMHIGWNNVIDWVFVFAVAMFYGYMFQRTNSLFGVTLSHGLSNSMLFLVMPFLIF